jgi:hypothetical protein
MLSTALDIGLARGASGMIFERRGDPKPHGLGPHRREWSARLTNQHPEQRCWKFDNAGETPNAQGK